MEDLNIYNVIWVDDEIDELLSPVEIKRLLRNQGIHIKPAHNSTEYREIMEHSYDRIDAVITDANMARSSDSPKNERDLSGFEDVKSCIEKYNVKRSIPFYLYSGRGEFLEERYENDGLEYFVTNNRIFSKGELPRLLEQLRKDVAHINSPSFRIRNKYHKELEAARLIENNEETLFSALLYEYTDGWNNTQDYFNPARKMVERIFHACKKRGIIPYSLSELNSFSGFLQGKDCYFEVNEGCEIMPKPLIHSLEYFLNITQDGSHGAGDIKLNVDNYVRNTKNINLFRTILYIAMDLCLWFAKASQLPPEERVSKWHLKPNCEFVYRGTIRDIEGKMVCGEYLLQNKEVDYSAGDEIGIRQYKGKAIPENKHPFDYQEAETKITVSKFAYPTNVIIIRKRETEQAL